jgi:hypothetical protein
MSKTSIPVVEQIRKAKEELEKSVKEAEDLSIIGFVRKPLFDTSGCFLSNKFDVIF